MRGEGHYVQPSRSTVGRCLNPDGMGLAILGRSRNHIQQNNGILEIVHPADCRSGPWTDTRRRGKQLHLNKVPPQYLSPDKNRRQHQRQRQKQSKKLFHFSPPFGCCETCFFKFYVLRETSNFLLNLGLYWKMRGVIYQVKGFAVSSSSLGPGINKTRPCIAAPVATNK